MKSIKVYKLIIVTLSLTLGILGGSLFGQCPTLYSHSNANNSSSFSANIGKDRLICDESTSIGSALEFSANYSLSSLTQVSSPIFKITYDGTTLFEVKFDNQKITVNRYVQWKECTSWSGGACTTYAAPVFGMMTYSTWDDEFIESITGWISIKLADNGLWIKTSTADSNGPYKSDFSYEGLHLSGIEAKLNSSLTANFSFSLESSAASGVNLSNISFKAGGLSYIEAVTVVNSGDSPETNYPPAAPKIADGEGVAMSTQIKQSGKLKIYPNPVEESLTMDLESTADEVVEVTLYDTFGRAILSEKHAVTKGFNRILLERLKSRGVVSGAFILNATSNTLSASKMLIMK